MFWLSQNVSKGDSGRLKTRLRPVCQRQVLPFGELRLTKASHLITPLPIFALNMTYQQTLDWLFSQLPMYQRSGQAGYKPGLDNTLRLMELLGHPEKQFKSIHVAGTNGKGSVSHMLAAIFQKAGYKTGLYTSPHLKDFRERIRINGQMIPESEVIGFVEKHRDEFSCIGLSFFEMTVGMAFHYFAKEQVDIAIVEVGMGGRLDSTNVITPELSVITNISFDHMQFLGDTLPKIAREKAGIIKSGVPVVIGEALPETKPVFESIAKERKAPVYYTDKNAPVWKNDLPGPYQPKNIATIQKCVFVLEEMAYPISSCAKEALKAVKPLTGLRGRWDIIQEKPKIILDTGHNEAGVKLIVNQILKEKYSNIHIIWGMVNDKETSSILRLLPPQAQYYFCQPDIPRGKSAKELQQESYTFNLVGEIYPSVKAALEAAKKNAHTGDLIFVGGSTFVVAEVI